MVHVINLGSKAYDCEIGLAFLGEALDVLKVSIEQLGENLQNNPFKTVPTLIFIAAKVAADLDDKEFSATPREVLLAMEADGGMSSPGGKKFLDLLYKYMTKDVPKPEEAPPKDIKKKVKKTEAKTRQ